ncbi:MAG TPA: phage holin family protein [Pseudonocardia sp.]|nr:phage holin family protein [Pseudonocardia sp.]
MSSAQYPTGSSYPAGGAHAADVPHGATGTRDVGDVPLGELIGDVTRDLSTLMRQELALAQAELKQEATKAGKGAGALAGAGLAGYMTVLFLSIALWWALSHLVGHSWSALIVAVLWGIVAAVLYTMGRNKLRQVHPPERTVETVKNVPDAVTGGRGGQS